MSQFLNPPPQWTNQPLVLYHGTLQRHATNIQNSGIDLRYCDPDTDFGRGFYTTTIFHQASHWAWQQQKQRTDKPVVIQYVLDREDLAGIDTLYFIDGSYSADDFWSLVFHCRQTSSRNPAVLSSKPTILADHQRLFGAPYDVVVGPVAAFWKQRSLMQNADQISFHTPRAVMLLRQQSQSTTVIPITL